MPVVFVCGRRCSGRTTLAIETMGHFAAAPSAMMYVNPVQVEVRAARRILPHGAKCCDPWAIDLPWVKQFLDACAHYPHPRVVCFDFGEFRAKWLPYLCAHAAKVPYLTVIIVDTGSSTSAALWEIDPEHRDGRMRKYHLAKDTTH